MRCSLILALLLLTLVGACSSGSGKEGGESFRRYTGYAFFTDQSPAMFYPSADRSAFVPLVYRQRDLPKTVRSQTPSAGNCLFTVFKVTVIGRKRPKQGLRDAYLEVRTFTSVDAVSRTALDGFLKRLDSAAMDPARVCPSVAESNASSKFRQIPATRPGLCNIASAPAQYRGQIVTLNDVIVVDSSLRPLLVPDADCRSFAYFEIEAEDLDEDTRNQLADLILSRNNANFPGPVGIAGVFTVQLTKQSAPQVWTMKLIAARDMHVVGASSKSAAVNKQMPPQLRN